MAEEPASTGGMGTADAIQAAQETLTKMVASMGKLVAQSKQIALNFGATSKSMHGMSATSAPAGGAGNTGAGQPTAMNNSLALISSETHVAHDGAQVTTSSWGKKSSSGDGGGGSRTGGTASFAAATLLGVGKVVYGAAQDATTGTTVAMAREWAAFQVGGANTDRMKQVVAGARNNYNVSDPTSLYTGIEGLSNAGIGVANAGGVGQFAKLVSSSMQAGTAAGQTSAQAAQATSNMYGGPQTYALMGMGIQNRNANGSMKDLNAVAEQMWKRFYGNQQGITRDDVDISFGPGATIRVSLESAGMTEDQIQQIKQLFYARATANKSLTSMSPSDINAANPLPKGAASERKLANATTNKTESGYQATIKGNAAVNDTLAAFQNKIGDATGAVKGFIDALNTVRGGYESSQSSALGQSVSSGAGNFLGSLVGNVISGGGGGGAKVAAKAGSSALKTLLSKGAGAAAGWATIAGAGETVAALGGLAAVALPAAIAVAAVGTVALVSSAVQGKKSDAQKTLDDLKQAYTVQDPQTHLWGPDKYKVAAAQAVVDAEKKSKTDMASGSPLATPSHASGVYDVSKTHVAEIHKGEMVVPENMADTLRKKGMDAADATFTPRNSGSNPGATVNIYVTLTNASDAQAMKLATTVKSVINNDRELVSLGAGRGSGGY